MTVAMHIRLKEDWFLMNKGIDDILAKSGL